MSLSDSLAANLLGVKRVIAWREIFKVLGTIVCFDAVLVVDLKPIWAFPDEGCGNKLMDANVPTACPAAILDMSHLIPTMINERPQKPISAAQPSEI